MRSFTMSNKALFVALMLLTMSLASSACGQASGQSNSPPSPATKQAVSAQPGTSSVVRIVFIDQEQACDCTQTRINNSWTALQAALGQDSGISVERIHRDTQEEQAEEYRLLRPMVTVPGIYLLDQSGAIVELLQGEVSEEQARAALGGESST